jgi:uncharacterized membrane protein
MRGRATVNGGFALPLHRLPCHDEPFIVGEAPMSAPGLDPSQQSTVSGRQIAMIVYILYFVSYFTGITALIGVIIAHVQLASADGLLNTHYRFQIRTFWIGLLYIAIGIVLTTAVVGIAVLFWWFVWSLVRNVKGVLALNDHKPIANPSSWMFG